MFSRILPRPRAAAVLVVALAVCASRQTSAFASDQVGPQATVAPHLEPFDRAKQETQAALTEVAALLSRTDLANMQAWRAWMEWDALVALVESEYPDPGQLLKFESRLRQNFAGLESDQFRRLRDSLRTLAVRSEQQAAHSENESQADRRREVNELASRLGEQPTHTDAARAAELLDWLSRIDDAGAREAAAIRHPYAQPNVSARVSRRFAQYMLARVVEDSRPFTATAMGAQSSGTAITRVNVGVRFTPDEDQGAISLTLNGAVRMPDTVSTQRRVTVYSSSDVAISAVKSVNVNHHGFRFDPASANAVADVRINDVSAELQIIERLARRRVNRMRPEAESDTSRRVASEIETRADELSSKLLTNAHKFFCEQIRSPLLRLDALPDKFKFSTTADHFQIVALQRTYNQLAAAVSAPPFTQQDDLAFRVHESFLNNLSASLLPGKTVHDRVWLEIHGVMTGSRPRGLWVHDREAPWSATFAEQLPVSTRIGDGRIQITLRFDFARVGEQTWRTPIRVEATLEPRITRDGPAFYRDGEVTIHIDGMTADGASANLPNIDILHRTLTRKFNAVFPAELHFDGLVAPEGGALGKLNALKLTDLRCERGWFSLGYHLNARVQALPGKAPPANESSNESSVAQQ